MVHTEAEGESPHVIIDAQHMWTCCCVCHVQVAKRELSMECDYEYEARCQKRFKKLISSDPDLAENFNVPDIIDELSGKTVITSEWVPGVHIDKVQA